MPFNRANIFVLMTIAILTLLIGGCGSAADPAAPVVPVPTSTTAPSGPAPTATPVPTPTPDPNDPKYGGIATFANRNDPPGWDPMRTGTITLHNIAATLYGEGNLVRQCRDDVFSICSNLADSWEANADFTEWTFKIRDNVLWHDGTPFTAEDAAWYLNIALNGVGDRKAARWKSNLGDITKISVIGGNEVSVTLSGPAPRYIGFLAPVGQKIAHPRHLMQPEIDAGNTTVTPNEVGYVATGPYKMLEYNKGSVVRVRRNDLYWEKDSNDRKLPFLDGIDFPIITDKSAMFAAFRTGRLDGTARGSGYFANAEQRAPIVSGMGNKAWFANIPAYNKIIGINSRVAPWNDQRVRQAVNLYVDRQSGIDAVHSGDGVLFSLFPPGSPLANPGWATWPGWNPATKEADRNRANELLTDAGFSDGFPVSILCRDRWVAFCEWTEGQLTGLLGKGNVSIDVVDTATYNDRKGRGDWEIDAPSGSAHVTPEDMQAYWLTTNPNAKNQHDDTNVDKMFIKLANTPDGPERTKLAQELEYYLVQDQVLGIPTWFELGVVAYRSYIKGMPVPPVCSSCSIDMATVWIDKS
ncbi:MAG: hypothetical protein BZY82_09075 [SAR202 cluster bacterium Io17-Chloro-G3]|nr:MAG: hypothetical protein BZY82_09075 [SAR202 cluster bacterium Io17-Chloro-G3]